MSADTDESVIEDAESTSADSTSSGVVVRLAQAFDLAWARFLAAEGPIVGTDENRRRLANQLVALSRTGEADVEALARGALIHLHAVAAAMRLSERGKVVVPFPEAGASFAPDTVDAMRSAIELCLEELPLRIPSDVREALSTEIMKRAAQGERDPAKLRDAALAAPERRR